MHISPCAAGIVQAVSLTLKEQVASDRREIRSRDWSGYPILTLSEVPSVEVILMDRSDPSPGAGEGSLPPTSAAPGERLGFMRPIAVSENFA
jgi:nicotinate dehydrogenase subunit B